MKAITKFRFVLFLGILMAFEGRPYSAENQEAIIDAIQKRYESTTDFTADFQQETEVRTLKKNLKTKGKVYFKRPGKMLWRFEEPKDQFVLADGENLYFYQPDQNQVIRTPLKKAFRSDIPLSFLLGIGNLKKDFSATVKGTEGDRYLVQLRPKGDVEGVNELVLGVDRKNYDIVSAKIKDASENLTTIRFAGLKRGVGLKDSIFNFKPPDGVDIVEFGPPS